MSLSVADMMRRSLPLLALVLASASVNAQERGGWVDPPSKGAEAEKNAAAQASQDTKQAATAKRRTRSAERVEAPAKAKRHVARSERSRPMTHAMGPRPAYGHDLASQGQGAVTEEAAVHTVSDYLAAVSSGSGLVSTASRFYGERVRFHGRLMTRAALAAEKARFARRWPERSYEPRGMARTQCDANRTTCTVTTAFGYRAANPARGARSVGFGELTVTVGLAGERPVILSESSRVLRRGPGSLDTAGRSGGAG